MAERRSGSVVITAKTVDEAVQRALRQLGLNRSQVEVTVLTEGRPGIFGIGATPAEVRVSARGADAAPGTVGEGVPLPRIDDYAEYAEVESRPSPDRGHGREGRSGRGGGSGRERGGGDRDGDHVPRGRYEGRGGHRGRDQAAHRAAPRRPEIPPFELIADPDYEPEEEDPTRFATAVLTDLLHLMGIEAEVVARDPETPMDGLNHARAVLDVTPSQGEDDQRLLVGRRGEHLAALQYVLNLTVNRTIEGRHAFTVDIAGYKRAREKKITTLAYEVAAEVKESGETVSLEPMSAAERRIVHLALAEDPDVETESTGEGDARRVQIVYREP